jgi:translocation and assembly module TamA
MRKLSGGFALLMLYSVTAFAASVPLSAPPELHELLASHLQLDEAGNLDDAPTRAAFERRMRREVGDLLATEGYFSPSVRVEKSVDQESPWSMVVDPGVRSLIGEVRIELRGDVDSARRDQLLAGWKLKTWSPFRQADWDDAKQSLLRELMAVDHAAARQHESRAEVDVAARRVDLQVVIEAGPRYRFGDLKFVGLARYAPELLARYNHGVRPGEAYREDKLLALQTALQNTPYFASVSVDLELPEAGDVSSGGEVSTPVPVHVPIRISVRERTPHRLQLGAGVSSNTGARVEAGLQTTDLFRRAWELNSGIRLEQLKQAAYADLLLPAGARDAHDSVGVAVENSEVQGLSIRRLAFGTVRVQRNGSVEQRRGVSWQQESQSPQDALATTSRALSAQATWTWRHADDPLDPAEGISTQFQLAGATRALLSDQTFVRGYLRYQQGIPLGQRDALLLRGEMGVTLARSRQGIPQDFLFRAGGSNSVRGYGYQSLGVKEGAATVGGRYLLTASAEYTHWLDAHWGAAVFVDAGQASDDRHALVLAKALGVGARWRSPAGPLALDVAWGLRDSKLRLHFSLAVPF